MIGVLASVVGMLVGLGLGVGLFKLFDAVGFTLPNNGLVFATRTVVVAMLVGIVVTLLASLRPALRATRVPPIAAVREGADAAAEGASRATGRLASALLTLARLRGARYGLFGERLGTTKVLLWMGLGTVLIFFGVALLSARIARPLAQRARLAGGETRRRGRSRSRATTREREPAAHARRPPRR